MQQNKKNVNTGKDLSQSKFEVYSLISTRRQDKTWRMSKILHGIGTLGINPQTLKTLKLKHQIQIVATNQQKTTNIPEHVTEESSQTEDIEMTTKFEDTIADTFKYEESCMPS